MTEPRTIITPGLVFTDSVRVSGKRLSFHVSGQWASRLLPGRFVRMAGFGDKGFTDSDAEIARRDYLGENVYRFAVWRASPQKK